MGRDIIHQIIMQGGKVRNIQDKKRHGATDKASQWARQGKARQGKRQGKSRQEARQVKARGKASQGKGQGKSRQRARQVIKARDKARLG
jgi:hypothetical protein